MRLYELAFGAKGELDPFQFGLQSFDGLDVVFIPGGVWFGICKITLSLLESKFCGVVLLLDPVGQRLLIAVQTPKGTSEGFVFVGTTVIDVDHEQRGPTQTLVLSSMLNLDTELRCAGHGA